MRLEISCSLSLTPADTPLLIDCDVLSSLTDRVVLLYGEPFGEPCFPVLEGVCL